MHYYTISIPLTQYVLLMHIYSLTMQVINTYVNPSIRYKNVITSTQYYFTMKFTTKCDHF